MQRISASIEDLRRFAPGVERAPALRLLGPRGPVQIDPVEYSRQVAPLGTQEFVNLADDLFTIEGYF